jgi:Family of unknown function (DUF6220)
VQALRTIYRYWAGIVFLAVIAQIAAAAYGAFYTADKLTSQPGDDDASHTITEVTFDKGFDFHTGFGYIIFLGSVLLLLLALAARVGRPRIWWNLALPVLLLAQIVLAWISEEVAAVGPIHGVNALIILSLSGYIAYAEWGRARRAAVEAGTAT